jgi:hypothetical protein
MNTLEWTPPFAPGVRTSAPAAKARVAEPAPAAPRTLTRVLLVGAAIVSLASGLLHFGAVPEHWGNYRIAALFFVALGIFQVAWAAMVLGRPSRILYAVGAAVSLGTIATWAVSRTTGLPFGPFTGMAERAGRADVISTLLEEALVLALILLAFGVGERRRPSRLEHRAALGAIGAVTAMLTVWGLSGLHAGAHGAVAGVQVGLLSELVGHHGLHLVFAGGAVVVYASYVIAHVRRHGWPSFSWKLTP